jgi:hypothetical protein
MSKFLVFLDTIQGNTVHTLSISASVLFSIRGKNGGPGGGHGSLASPFPPPLNTQEDSKACLHTAACCYFSWIGVDESTGYLFSEDIFFLSLGSKKNCDQILQGLLCRNLLKKMLQNI